MRAARWLVILFGLGLVGQAQAQHPQTRDGFWLSAGLGYGSLGCGDCDGREGGFSGNFALGGTLSPKVLLGGATNAWTKSEGGGTLTVSTVTALVRFYPSATGAFFLTGGLGFGTVRASLSGLGSGSESGAGAVIGLGYDIRIGPNVSLTPYYNGFAVNSDALDANVGQIGFGITVH